MAEKSFKSQYTPDFKSSLSQPCSPKPASPAPVTDPCAGMEKGFCEKLGCGENEAYLKRRVEELTNKLKFAEDDMRTNACKMVKFETENTQLAVTVKDLEGKNRALNQRLDDTTQQLEKLTGEKCQQDMKMQAMKTDMDKKLKELNAIKCELAQMNAQLIEKTEAATKYLFENQTKDATISELLAELAMCRTNLTSLEDTVGKKDDKICHLQQLNDRCQDQCDEHKQMLTKCQGELVGMQCQLEEIPRLKEQIACMQQQLREKAERLCDAESALEEIPRLKDQMNCMKQQLRDKGEYLCEAETSLSGLKSDLKAKDDDMAEARNAVNNLRVENSELKRSLADQRSQLMQMQELEKVNKELERKLADKDQGLSAKATACDEESKELKNQIKKLNFEMFDLQQLIQAEKDKYKGLECHNQELNCTIKSLQCQIEDHKNNMEKYRECVRQEVMNELNKQKQEIENLQQHIQQQAQEIESWKRKVAELNHNLQEKLKVIEEKDQQLAAAKRDAKRWEDTLQEHKNNISCLNDCIMKQSREMESVRGKVAELNKLVEEKAAVIKEKEMQISELHLSVRSEQCKLEGCCDQLQIKKNELADARCQLEQACAQIRKQSSDIQDINGSLRQTQQYVDKLCEEIRKAKEEIGERDSRLCEQQVKLLDFSCETERLKREIDMHMCTVQKQKEQTMNLQENFDRLQKEYSQLKQKHCELEYRAESAACELKKCQAEVHNRAMCMDKQEKALCSMQQTLSSKDNEICIKAQRVCDLENQLMENRTQLDEATTMYRVKDSVVSDYIKEVQRLGKDNGELQMDMKRMGDKICQLEDNVKGLKCSNEGCSTQLRSLRDQQNVKSALGLIERTLTEMPYEYGSETRSLSICSAKQEMMSIFQICCQSQEEGLMKVAQLLITRVSLTKELRDAKMALEQHDKQFRSMQQEYHKVTQESKRTIDGLKDKLRKVQCDLQCKDTAYKQLELDYNRNDNKLHDLKRQLDEECKRYETTLCDLKRCEAKSKGDADDAACQRRMLEDENQSLKCTLNKQQNALERADKACETLTRGICEEKLAKEDAQRMVEEQKSQLCSKACQIAELERQINEVCEKCRTLEQHMECYSRMEGQVERLIKTFLDRTHGFIIQDQTFGRGMRSNAEVANGTLLDDFEKRMENVICIASGAQHDKEQGKYYQQEANKKAREVEELCCNLQMEKATVAEKMRMIGDLQRLIEEACSQASSQEKELRRTQKTVSKLEGQLQNMGQLKRLYEESHYNESCLKEKLSVKQRLLHEEIQTTSRCKDSLNEYQSSCQKMMDDLRYRDDQINILKSQCMNLNSDLCSRDDQINRLRHQCQQMNEDIIDKDDQLVRIKCNCQKMVEDLCSQENQTKILNGQLSQQESTIRALHEQLRCVENCSPYRTNYSMC